MIKTQESLSFRYLLGVYRRSNSQILLVAGRRRSADGVPDLWRRGARTAEGGYVELVGERLDGRLQGAVIRLLVEQQHDQSEEEGEGHERQHPLRALQLLAVRPEPVDLFLLKAKEFRMARFRP